MARRIEEIKLEITTAWLDNEVLSKAYGFTKGEGKWEDYFSKVSIENIICYIMASAIWVHEKLFDAHKQEVETIIEQMKPHTKRWYANKVKAFRMGQGLIEGTDQYSNINGKGEEFSPEDIEKMQVVKYASVTDQEGVVYIKIAGEEDGHKVPVSAAEALALSTYLNEIKDAGIRLKLINQKGNKLNLSLRIYYNPMILTLITEQDSQKVSSKNIRTGQNTIKETIEGYVENLPFNGEFRPSELIDRLQKVEGVVIPELIEAQSSLNGNDWSSVEAYCTPEAGYYCLADLTIDYKPYV